MYNKNSVDRSYEDAIPVKRSRRAERARSELRRENAIIRDGVDFSVRGNSSGTEKIYVPMREINAEVERKNTVRRPVGRPVPVSEKKASDEIKISLSDKTTERAVRSMKDVVSSSKNAETPRDLNESAQVPEMTLTEPETSVNENNETEIAGVVNQTESKEVISHESQNFENTDSMFVYVGGSHTIVRAFTGGEVIKKSRLTVGKVIGRTLLSLFTVIVLLVGTLFGGLAIAANGPSPTIRDFLVLSALQASATKWVPGIFLEDEVVDQILKDSQKVNTDVISVDEYTEQQKEEETEDKWANAIDGMIYESISGPTFKGYVLLVRDPSRISVGVATDHFSDTNEGMRIFEMADKYGAVAAINGGEYPDAGGMGIGGRPIGITYSDGKCVWSDGLRRSFMGFDKNDRLIVREGLTKAEAEELGIRDGVCFQTGKTLITNENGNVTMYYADNNTGTAQRTAIGQTADGTVILLVTDGRTASSLGATHNDVIDVMVSYGAISAGMLDGGSSSLMYYRDFYDKYGLDKTNLDEYQRMGLINKYKAFTTPRRIPTCFIVAPE